MFQDGDAALKRGDLDVLRSSARDVDRQAAA